MEGIEIMKKLIICLLLSTALLVSCTSEKESNTGDSSNSNKETAQNNKDIENTKTPSNNEDKVDEMSQKVKDYILNVQGDKPEGSKLNWSKEFLEKVNMKSVYEKYIKDGGADADVEGFAKYITLYAPISNDWEEMFKKDIYNNYKQNIVSIKQLDGDLYRGYIKYEQGENGYVTEEYVIVSARTGFYHVTSNYNNGLGEVKAKVQVYAGAYFDSRCYGENRANPYNEVVISNITSTSFDFTVNEVEYVDIKKSTKQTRKLIFKTNRAYFREGGTKAAFYGKDYTLKFTFPNNHDAFPVVTDMKITGFKPLEGNTYLNNVIPGHEFG